MSTRLLRIEVAEHATGARPAGKLLQAAFDLALERNGASPRPKRLVSLALVDDARIAELSGRFRGCTEPTDVLSFPEGKTDLETGRVHLGEIVISAETAAREAAHRGVPVEQETLLYAVHGLLHLLGHEDESEAGRAAMIREQFAVLEALPGFHKKAGLDVRRARAAFSTQDGDGCAGKVARSNEGDLDAQT